MCRALVILIAGALLTSAPARAEVIYTLQARQVAYEIEVGDMYSSDVYEDSIHATDFEPFNEGLYFNVEWPDGPWTDVEGRAAVGQFSSLTDTGVITSGASHVHAFVEEDQTQAFADANSESSLHVEFDLTSAATVSLSGETTWVRSTVDPPRVVSLHITLYEGSTAIFSHVRNYTYPSGVVQDDGDVFAFEDVLAAGSYVIEIIAYAEAYSHGPWRQYAEGTVTYDVTMAVSVHGDMDCDGDVDIADDSPLFIKALLDPAGYAPPPDCTIEQADMNGDKAYDGQDVAGFLAALLP